MCKLRKNCVTHRKLFLIMLKISNRFLVVKFRDCTTTPCCAMSCKSPNVRVLFQKITCALEIFQLMARHT